MANQTSFNAKSDNAKTGRMGASYSSAAQCPTACPLRTPDPVTHDWPAAKSPCYASAGFHTRLHWKKVTDGDRGHLWGDFLAAIGALPSGTPWRHNVAGDLDHIGDLSTIDRRALAALSAANQGKRGYTYTHYDLVGDLAGPKSASSNLAAVKSANENGFTVNVSANDLDHVDRIKRTDPTLPICTLLPTGTTQPTRTPDGHLVIVCPFDTHGIQCVDCMLCAQPQRRAVIGFPSHGPGAAKATAIAEATQ